MSRVDGYETSGLEMGEDSFVDVDDTPETKSGQGGGVKGTSMEEKSVKVRVEGGAYCVLSMMHPGWSSDGGRSKTLLVRHRLQKTRHTSFSSNARPGPCR